MPIFFRKSTDKMQRVKIYSPNPSPSKLSKNSPEYAPNEVRIFKNFWGENPPDSLYGLAPAALAWLTPSALGCCLFHPGHPPFETSGNGPGTCDMTRVDKLSRKTHLLVLGMRAWTDDEAGQGSQTRSVPQCLLIILKQQKLNMTMEKEGWYYQKRKKHALQERYAPAFLSQPTQSEVYKQHVPLVILPVHYSAQLKKELLVAFDRADAGPIDHSSKFRLAGSLLKRSSRSRVELFPFVIHREPLGRSRIFPGNSQPQRLRFLAQCFERIYYQNPDRIRKNHSVVGKVQISDPVFPKWHPASSPSNDSVHDPVHLGTKNTTCGSWVIFRRMQVAAKR